MPYRLSEPRSCNRNQDDEIPSSPASSESSVDEEEINRRVRPYWPKYHCLFLSRGFRLDTVKDVKLYYEKHPTTVPCWLSSKFPGNSEYQDDNALCPDAGLPDNLFRGTRICDSKRVVFKAVHAGSREYSIIRFLSQPSMRNDHMNHTIPVVDLFDIVEDNIAFIIMEEWSSNLVNTSGRPCCLTGLLSALRQSIEHIVFLHKHGIAHLDISLMNLLTDYNGHYAFVDYENSRHFRGLSVPLVYNYRGTELPPETERNSGVDPFRVDVWALAVLMLRACKSTGYWIPELMYFIKPMLHEDPTRRPSAFGVLQAFDKVIISLGYRPGRGCHETH